MRWREKRAQDTRTEVGERRWSRKINGGPGKPGTCVVSEDLREGQEFFPFSRKKKRGNEHFLKKKMQHEEPVHVVSF